MSAAAAACLLSAAVFDLHLFLLRISVFSALWLMVLLILYVNLCNRPQEVLNAEKARVQAALPVSAQVISVQRATQGGWSAVLMPDAGSGLPAELTFVFRTPAEQGERVQLRVFPDRTPAVVMTKEDFLSYCLSLEQQQSDLNSRKRFFRVLFVVTMLLAALGVGFREFLSSLGAIG